MHKITLNSIEAFGRYLTNSEKATTTVSKYLRDVLAFKVWLGARELSKSAVLEYKALLCGRYAPASVNASIASLNSYFNYIELYELRIKSLKLQKQVFVSGERELTKSEYEKLLSAAERSKNERLYLLMQTICSTGIRVSEVCYITVTAVARGVAEINCKGKRRQVFLPKQLCKLLGRYTFKNKIKSGSVFVTKNGKPLDRSNIWSDMKKLCEAARVSEKKVFPHNLRHLFARTYYSRYSDVVRLADILGHNSINTTRIYTAESGEIHRRRIQSLGLLRC